MRRTPVLKPCLLLALASSAWACSSGYFKMELVGTNSASHALAKCLSSVQVALDSSCGVTLTSTAAGGNFVPSVWYPATADAYTYRQLKECPVEGTVVAGGASTTTRLAAIESAFSNHVYGSGLAIPTTLAYTAGKVVATSTADSKTFTFVISEMTLPAVATDLGDAANIKVLTDGAAAGLTSGTEFTNTITASCTASEGRYGFILNDSIKVCALCPVGTTGDGGSCNACPAGRAGASGVGATTCAACDAGTYAAEGSSDCLPCPQHTYSAGTAGQCTNCPIGSYAWVPGSTGCVRCVAGVPKCSAGAMDGESSCNNAETASPGYSVLSVAQMGTCGLAGDYAVPAYTKCASWKADASPSLQLSLFVAGDCSVVVSPITDRSCSEPGNVINTTYTYATLQIHAFYQTTKTIRTLLPSTGDSDGSSSYMMSLDQSATANRLDMLLFAATSSTSAATTATALCNNTVTVQGGSVAQVGPATANRCPPGSYYDANKMCPPCSAGSWCPGGVAAAANTTACDAGTYNAYLGQTALGLCTTCPTSTPSYTSDAGASYCTVLAYETDCPDGYEWEGASLKCTACLAGTFRAKGGPTLECQDCEPGYYSPATAKQCTICPAGQYSPTSGLADQNPGNAAAAKCLLCPAGSLALSEAEDVDAIATLTTGATTCEACPAGKYTNESNPISVCLPCAAGTYRSGDAAPENNVCILIPAGYKADDNSAATTVTPCPSGTASYWTDSSTRVPDKATFSTACQSCDDFGNNTYAPRQGMANCLLCQGGYIPSKSVTGLLGSNQCSECGTNTYRGFYTVQPVCATCGAGAEVGPSNRQACTACRPGTYKTLASGADYCDECPINKFVSSAGASDCAWCARGYETHESGSTECTACALGFYSAAEASDSSKPNCVAAPAGSYVNTTAAYAYILCASGTFSKEEASDSCDPCPPGQFANNPGSKSCKTCQAGTFSSGQAAACRSCPAGYYSPTGASACSPCKPGYYTSLVRSGSCSLCPRGKQCPSIATANPKLCPRGYFSSKEGAKLCTACPVNTFAATTGSLQCAPCAIGTSTRGLTGQSACQDIRPTALRRSLL